MLVTLGGDHPEAQAPLLRAVAGGIGGRQRGAVAARFEGPAPDLALEAELVGARLAALRQPAHFHEPLAAAALERDHHPGLLGQAVTERRRVLEGGRARPDSEG